MSLFSDWKDLAYQDRTQESYDAFWGDYLPKEQVIYEAILSQVATPIEGSVSGLSATYDMDNTTFVGFLDGINSSLKSEFNLEDVSEETVITLDVDLSKLYYNMMEAKADWLYSLPVWDDLLTAPQQKEIKKAYNKTRIVVNEAKVGRNDPCPCGSGRKYKQCCLNK